MPSVTFYAIVGVLLSIETSASARESNIWYTYRNIKIIKNRKFRVVVPFKREREIDDNFINNDNCLTPGCVNVGK